MLFSASKKELSIASPSRTWNPSAPSIISQLLAGDPRKLSPLIQRARFPRQYCQSIYKCGLFHRHSSIVPPIHCDNFGTDHRILLRMVPDVFYNQSIRFFFEVFGSHCIRKRTNSIPSMYLLTTRRRGGPRITSIFSGISSLKRGKRPFKDLPGRAFRPHLSMGLALFDWLCQMPPLQTLVREGLLAGHLRRSMFMATSTIRRACSF